MIKALLFDWDGVVARRKNFVPIWEVFLQKYGVPTERTKSALFKVDKDYQRGGITNLDFWQSISKDIGVPADVYEWNALFFSEREINTELVERLQKVRDRYKLGIVSNNFDIMRDRIFREFSTKFDFFSFSCDTGYSKPSVVPFNLIAEKLKISLNELLFVDDDHKNIEVLDGTGVEGVTYSWERDSTSRLYQRLEQLGVRI